MPEFIQPIMTFGGDWQKMTETLGMKAMQNPDEIGAASVDYLMYSGYLTLAYFWARMAKVAQEKLAVSDDDSAFYQAKLKQHVSIFNVFYQEQRGMFLVLKWV